MEGIGYLRKVKQDFIQYHVYQPINMSGKLFAYRDDIVINPEEVLIYKGYAPTIEISTRSEYELYKKVNNDSDYRVVSNGLLFCLDGEEDYAIIGEVVDAVEDYYITGQYEQAIDNLISVLEPSKKLELKK